jgi:putative flippase GtrA
MAIREAGPGGGPRPGTGGEPGVLQRLVKDQRVLFLIVGGANTAFSTALFAGLVLLFGPRVPSAVSLGIAWSVSLVLVFFVYRRLVFRVAGNLWRDFLRFTSVNVGSLLLNAAALTLLADIAGLPPIPTQIAITVLLVVFNYLGHRHFSFRRISSRDGEGNQE